MALGIGIVGAGKTGFDRARTLSAYSDVKIVGVAEPNRPVRDTFAKTFGVQLAVSDHRRLAADSAVDVVCICSPPATHSAVAVDCLQAGKHVICEQPMAVSAEQADEMMRTAEETGKRLFVSLPRRYDPVVQLAARLILDDEIGYPFLVLCTYISNEYDSLNNWHDWHGTWEVGGGGVLMECGTEITDLLQYLLGGLEAVNAVCTRFAIEPLNKAEDSCVVSLEFAEEITGELVFTGAARYSTWPDPYPGRAMRLEVYGLDGSIRLNDSEPRMELFSHKSGHVTLSPSDVETDLPTDMYRDFLDCILDGGTPLVTPEDANDALKVVLAAYKASQMKRRVELMEQL